MKLEFILEEEDYIKFNIYHMDNSKTYRNSILIQRYVTPIIFLMPPFVLAKITPAPFSYWMTCFGITFLIWICFFKKYLIGKVKRNIKKRLKEGNNNGLLGKRTIEISDNEIKETTEYRKDSVNINSVENVIINEEYIFMYINSIEAFIIPLRVFKDKQEKNDFMKYIESIKKFER